MIIKWIEVYISSLKYSISLNGELVGFFGSSKDLRQGDPLSSYLFVTTMKDLSNFLNKVMVLQTSQKMQGA